MEDNGDLSPAVAVLPGNPIGPPLESGELTVAVTATDASGNTEVCEVSVCVRAVGVAIIVEPDSLNARSGKGSVTARLTLSGGPPLQWREPAPVTD